MGGRGGGVGNHTYLFATTRMISAPRWAASVISVMRHHVFDINCDYQSHKTCPKTTTFEEGEPAEARNRTEVCGHQHNFTVDLQVA